LRQSLIVVHFSIHQERIEKTSVARMTTASVLDSGLPADQCLMVRFNRFPVVLRITWESVTAANLLI
ncbi:MAG TPA: hypothetical protein VKH62_09225, partial [Candidatus Binatia bacterium]|nr:hypothetical protein [Candidatus Binatia bacterium]